MTKYGRPSASTLREAENDVYDYYGASWDDEAEATQNAALRSAYVDKRELPRSIEKPGREAENEVYDYYGASWDDEAEATQNAALRSAHVDKRELPRSIGKPRRVAENDVYDYYGASRDVEAAKKVVAKDGSKEAMKHDALKRIGIEVKTETRWRESENSSSDEEVVSIAGQKFGNEPPDVDNFLRF